jgi:ABC-type uncharacterized transport system ATPase subunit
VRRLPGVESLTYRDGEWTIETGDGAQIMGKVAVALAEAGVDVERLEHRSPTLDDVFMAVTGSRLEVEG